MGLKWVPSNYETTDSHGRLAQAKRLAVLEASRQISSFLGNLNTNIFLMDRIVGYLYDVGSSSSWRLVGGVGLPRFIRTSVAVSCMESASHDTHFQVDA
jgi:hypothetical protein